MYIYGKNVVKEALENKKKISIIVVIQLIKMIIGTKSDYHLFVYNEVYVYLCNVQNTS